MKNVEFVLDDTSLLYDSYIIQKANHYFFPQWGMITGVGHLTRNRICFSMSYSDEELSEYISKGYTVNVCVFDNSEGDSWIAAFANVANSNDKMIEKHYYSDKKGDQVIIRFEMIDRNDEERDG